MPLQPVAPRQAQQMIDAGALLLDVRTPDAFARERIAQARNAPLDRPELLPPLAAQAQASTQPIIFHCASGQRTAANAALLAGHVGGQAHVLEGGLNAWKQAGLPVQLDRRQPIELQRQVQIAAGSMVLLGTVLGATVSPWFYVIPAFFGAGLTFAGLTGFCGLARLLMKMPWNRRMV